MNRIVIAAVVLALLLVLLAALLFTGEEPEPISEGPQRGDALDLEPDPREPGSSELTSLDELPESEPPEQPEAADEQLEFAGYVWNVRNYDGAPTSLGTWERSQAYVRSDDAMVLRLSSDDGDWRNAEVYTDVRGFGYGVYFWEVETRLDTLHPNTVFGLFTYESNAPGNREIDIEATRWGREGDDNMYATMFNVDGEPIADGWTIGDQANTRHAFIWEPGTVTWISEDEDGNTLYTRRSDTDISPDNERVHMNLWIFGSVPPEATTEVVVTDFSFTPLDEMS